MSFLNRLGFTMAAGASKMEYAMGALGWAGAAAGSRGIAMGARGHLAMSAGAGALYGGTIGRDPGQSRLGGAFTGALGGAGLYGAARYGRAGYRDFKNTNRLRELMVKKNWASGAGVMPGSSLGAAGRGAFQAMRRDASTAMGFIGSSATRASNGFNKFRGLHR
jgi:hypothetical protein